MELMKLLESVREQEISCQASLDHINRLHRIIDKFKNRGASVEYERETIDKLCKAENQLNAYIDSLVDYRAEALKYIDRLSGEERAVIYRHYISGDSWEAISSKMFMSERRVYLIRAKALDKLKKIYEEGIN